MSKKPKTTKDILAAARKADAKPVPKSEQSGFEFSHPDPTPGTIEDMLAAISQPNQRSESGSGTDDRIAADPRSPGKLKPIFPTSDFSPGELFHDQGRRESQSDSGCFAGLIVMASAFIFGSATFLMGSSPGFPPDIVDWGTLATNWFSSLTIASVAVLLAMATSACSESEEFQRRRTPIALRSSFDLGDSGFVGLIALSVALFALVGLARSAWMTFYVLPFHGWPK